MQPERLWIRYTIGLFLLLAAVAFNNLYSWHAINKTLGNNQIIHEADQQRLLSQQILLFANQLESGHPVTAARLLESIEKFEAGRARNTHASETPGTTLLADVKPFIAMAGTMETFIDLANRVQQSASRPDPDMIAQLNTLGRGALLTDLDGTIAELKAAGEAHMATLLTIQLVTLGVMVLLIALEALLIYAPAQLSVWRTMRQATDNAAILRLKSTELKQVNEALNRAAMYDGLTQLPNRSFLITRVAEALKVRPESYSLLSVDVDRFKAINDSAGQAAGDALLIAVADILKRCVSKDDIAARIGGDEFMVLTTRKPDALAAQISRSFEAPMYIGGRICQISVSMGFVRCKRWDRDPLTLLSNAELALQCGKDAGHGQIVEYSRKLREAVAAQDMLLAELPTAISDGHIMPYYQPQINLSDGSIAGIEILARWEHPNRGLISPDTFLPLAEKAGFARDLDYQIWNTALAQFRDWKNQKLVIPRISLNAAPVTIADPQVVHQIFKFLSEHEIAPREVAIEVLETTFIDSIFDIAALNIDKIIGAGLLVELDDFGTGYTSLSMLNQLSLSGIKLDRSLISPLPARGAESIVRAVLALAKEMELHVVAEGIETPEQAEYLTNIGCDIGQGYGFGKPMNASDFANWVQIWLCDDDTTEPAITLRA